jgi:nitrogen-specific signal transduction histidine kinase/ActR/RegA family two-component response regulator
MESTSPLAPLLEALQRGELDRAKVLAQKLEANRAPTLQLAAEVLHELKQPLLGIKAYGQMMNETANPPPSLPQMLAQVERMEQIIADFTRLVSDKAAPQEKVNLCSHVRAAARLFKLNPESARIHLEVDVPDSLELSGNGRLLEQLTLNLMNNARDAMSGLGRLKVVVGREGDRPVLYVADWGPGIPPAMRERLFEPYVTTKTRGSGLGLSVCKRIAHEHKATISLASPDAIPDPSPPATVFKVTFPLPEVAAAPRRRLLVVDDESIIRMVFQDLMRKECEVVEAETAEKAVEELYRGTFDLIITDKNLPGMSGLELAQEARRLNPHSKVMLMTGYPSVVTAQQAIELGLMDYLLKPFDDIREVRDKLRGALAAPLPGNVAKTKSKRVDVYEHDGASARAISDALALLGYEPQVLSEAAPRDGSPAGVVVSWDFAPASGKAAVQLGKKCARGAPFVILAEHLSMETALECLRGGSAGCLPKLLSDVKALSRELSRALRLS